ncbi:cytochrome P450 monooxygenase cytochrome P450 monooxygenase [Fusarium sp. NRRL 25303]|nr:cytochrome P450 monooxygenase cytochrome P450 monooxygenase [Fusarium sp. NRRL 25303]
MALLPTSSLYADLNIYGRQIRLLNICSTEADTEYCLEVADLDQKLNFHALSYEWGNPNVTEAITVNGHSIQVTQNLANALRYAPKHIESTDGRLRIWADAICINQKSEEEKNHQVPLMGDIYSMADVVLCWLGLPCETVIRGMEAVQTIAWNRSIHGADRKDPLLDASLSQVADSLSTELDMLGCVVDEAANELEIANTSEASVLFEILARSWNAWPTKCIHDASNDIASVLRTPGRIRPNHLSWSSKLRLLSLKIEAFYEYLCKMYLRIINETEEHLPFITGELSVRLTHTLRNIIAKMDESESAVPRFQNLTESLEKQVLSVRNVANFQWLQDHTFLYQEVPGTVWTETGTYFMVQMLTKSYWLRVWTFQEMILASRPIFACGDRSMSWSSLNSVLCWAYRLLNALPEQRPHFVLQEQWGFLKRLYKHYLGHLRYLASSRAAVRGLEMLDDTMGISVRGNMNMKATHNWGHSSELRATNPKDHFYAFLGICPLGLVPDYRQSKSVGQVCVDFLTVYLKAHRQGSGHVELQRGELMTLTDAGIGHGWFMYPDTPSWAPNYPGMTHFEDFNEVGHPIQTFPQNGQDLDEIFGGTQRPEIIGSKLLVSAILLDEIVASGPLRSHFAELYRNSTSKEAIHAVMWTMEYIMGREKYPTGCHPLEGLYTALRYGTIGRHKDSGESDISTDMVFQDHNSFARMLMHHLITESSAETPEGNQLKGNRLKYLYALLKDLDVSGWDETLTEIVNDVFFAQQRMLETQSGYVGVFPLYTATGDLDTFTHDEFTIAYVQTLLRRDTPLSIVVNRKATGVVSTLHGFKRRWSRDSEPYLHQGHTSALTMNHITTPYTQLVAREGSNSFQASDTLLWHQWGWCPSRTRHHFEHFVSAGQKLGKLVSLSGYVHLNRLVASLIVLDN